MKLLCYSGAAPRNIVGLGQFATGTELPVEDHIAEQFNNLEAEALGWSVREMPPPKSAKPATQKITEDKK